MQTSSFPLAGAADNEQIPSANRMPTPANILAPFLIHVLCLGGVPRSAAYLAKIACSPRRQVEAALQALSAQGQVRREGNGWVSIADRALQYKAAEDLRRTAGSAGWQHHLGFLEDSSWMQGIDSWLAFLDERLKSGEPHLVLCLELTTAFFLRLGTELMQRPDPARGGKFLETVMLVQMLCFSNRLYLEEATRLATLYYENSLGYRPEDLPLYMEMIEKITQFSLSKGSISTDLALTLDAVMRREPGEPEPDNPFMRMLEPIFSGMTDITDQARMQMVSAMATGLSHMAMHMRHFSVSEYIYSSLHSFDQENSSISLVWLSHYCFVLMRQGRFDAALDNLNLLFNCKDTRQDPLAFASAARGLAMYHFLHGRTDYAHTILDRETRLAIAEGIPHAFFLDPMNFDMLYVFEREGYPPVPRYELDEIIAEVLSQSSLLLQGAALRIKALRLRGKGASPGRVIALLRQSREKLHPERDTRELILTLHELANTLTMAGDYTEARQLRRIVEAHAGRAIDADIPYARLALAATIAPEQPSPDSAKPHLGSIMAAIHRRVCAIGDQDVAAAAERFAHTLREELRCVEVRILAPAGGRWHCLAADPAIDGGTDHGDEILPPPVSGTWRRIGRGRFVLTTGNEDSWLLLLISDASSGLLPDLDETDRAVLASFLEAQALLVSRSISRESRPDATRIQVPDRETPPFPLVGPTMRSLLREAEQVAASNASILVTGETGVGKERVAAHIHAHSGRTGELVAVHPASTSESLFESEFFGHERGAFTGATGLRKGFFEEADGGTLFLDEVGDVPALIQTKLLRVLQDGRFTRVGSNRSIRSDFRLIAATNKDLWREVREGRFRADLLFRIAVIPITVPSLRERRQDILPLVSAYMKYYCTLYAKAPVELDSASLELLRDYDWPGNVREVKNLLERVVLQGCFRPEFLVGQAAAGRSLEPGTPDLLADLPRLDELEKRYLSHVLRVTGGKIRGTNGAANLLDTKVSTLYAKLRRHGLAPREV